MIRLFRVSLLIAVLLPSCRKAPQVVEQESSREGELIAWIGDESITQSEFQALAAEQLRDRSGVEDIEAERDRLLDELIRRKLVLARAREAGFDRQPETIAMIERLISDRYLEVLAKDRFDADPVVSEEQIASFHADNEERYRVAGTVRAGVIWIKVSPRAQAEKRAEARARAEAIRKAAVGASHEAFTQLAREHSDDQATRYTSGDTGWLGEGFGLSEEQVVIRDVAKSLGKPGDVAALVEADDGFRIVRLSESRGPSIRPLHEVRDAIHYELVQTLRAEREDEFFNELKKGLELGVNRELLESVPLPAPPDLTRVPPAMPRDPSKK